MPLWTLMLSERLVFEPRDVLLQSPYSFPLWFSPFVICITVYFETFWKTNQVLFTFELPKAPSLC